MMLSVYVCVCYCVDVLKEACCPNMFLRIKGALFMMLRLFYFSGSSGRFSSLLVFITNPLSFNRALTCADFLLVLPPTPI